MASPREPRHEPARAAPRGGAAAHRGGTYLAALSLFKTKGPLSQSFRGFLCMGQKIYNLINIGRFIGISRSNLCTIGLRSRKQFECINT